MCMFCTCPCEHTLNNVQLRCRAQECAAHSTCNYFITTYDAFETGVCYTKREPYIFTLGEDAEFPDTGGLTRIDMVRVVSPFMYFLWNFDC